MDNRLVYDLNVCDISVISGIRPQGRSSDRTEGRTNYGLLYIFCGEATFWGDNGRKLLVAGGKELVFIPKGKRYRMKYTANSTTFVLVNFDVVGEGCITEIFSENIALLVKDDELYRIAKIMTSFELCGISKSIGTLFRKKELFYRLVGWLCDARNIRSLDNDIDPKIADGVRLLEQTYLENLPITKFSEASHMSINAFRSLFKKQFGTSPVKYRNELRIERAKELLLEGGFTIAEVAYACGFENVGYFCRYYRRSMGETPSQTKDSN